MAPHDRQDTQEQANTPKDNSHSMSRDEEEAIDTAVQAEQSPEVASASASDADAGELSTAGESDA